MVFYLFITFFMCVVDYVSYLSASCRVLCTCVLYFIIIKLVHFLHTILIFFHRIALHFLSCLVSYCFVVQFIIVCLAF